MSIFATLWTVACQAPESMRFPRQEYWSGLPGALPGESSCPRNWTWVSYVSFTGKQTLSHLCHLRSPQIITDWGEKKQSHLRVSKKWSRKQLIKQDLKEVSILYVMVERNGNHNQESIEIIICYVSRFHNEWFLNLMSSQNFHPWYSQPLKTTMDLRTPSSFFSYASNSNNKTEIL